MLKQNKGITLVALVITIIVLLILAGVSIALVVGDNGVLTQSKNSSDATKMAQMKEALGLAVASCQADYLSNYASNASTSFDDAINAKTLSDEMKDYDLTTAANNKSASAVDEDNTFNHESAGTYYVTDGENYLQVHIRRSSENGIGLIVDGWTDQWAPLAE